MISASYSICTGSVALIRAVRFTVHAALGPVSHSHWIKIPSGCVATWVNLGVDS